MCDLGYLVLDVFILCLAEMGTISCKEIPQTAGLNQNTASVTAVDPYLCGIYWGTSTWRTLGSFSRTLALQCWFSPHPVFITLFISTNPQADVKCW